MKTPESMAPVLDREKEEYKNKPEPFKKWRWNDGLKRNDRVGYSEYAVTHLINMTGENARWLDNNEDGPDTGDIEVPLEGHKPFYVDVKLDVNTELGRQWVDNNSVNLHIDSITLNKLESGNVETQREVLNIIADAAHEYVSGENLELLKHGGL